MSEKISIFLVEDEDIVAMLTEDLLGLLGHQVTHSAATLSAGLAIASVENFDLGLLDINLRGERSFAIADRLTERGIPFLFVSGYSNLGIEPRFNNAITLQKPFSLPTLEQKIDQAMANSKGATSTPSCPNSDI